MKAPTGKLAFAYKTIAKLEARIAELESRPPAPVAPEEPIAYMRNEGEPNNLVKCTFACPGAFGVYAKRAL